MNNAVRTTSSEQAHTDTAGVLNMLIGDLHYGSKVRLDQSANLNFFNREEAKARIKRVFRYTRELAMKHAGRRRFDRAVVALAGDLVEGGRVVNERALDLPEVGGIQALVPELADTLMLELEELRDTVADVSVVAVAGNHGSRKSRPSSEELAQHNADTELYALLAGYAKRAGGIEVHYDLGLYQGFQVYNSRYLLVHGDKVDFSKRSKASSASGSALVPEAVCAYRRDLLTNLVSRDPRYNWDPEYLKATLLFGHFHASIEDRRRGIIGTGSLKGFDAFGADNLFAPETPSCKVWIEHPRAGVVLSTDVFGIDPIAAPEQGVDLPPAFHSPSFHGQR